MDDFFKEKNMEEEQDVIEPEKIKVGEREYTTEELNRLVGLGEIAQEAEERYNRPISKFWPEYTKTRQELEKKDQELEELRKVAQNSRVQETISDQEKLLKEAKEQLRQLGYLPADEIEQLTVRKVQEAISGLKMLDQLDSTINRFAQDGYVKASREDLLEYMNEKGINDPEVAYKIKYEKEIDEIKQKKLASIKSSGLVTEGRSTAGGKLPQPVKVTKDNLQEAISSYLRRE